MMAYIETLSPTSPEVLWIVIIAFVIAFFLAFGVGANDVANSFGTSVGSKVLTLRQACILATIFEILGSITLGYKVSHTIRKGMFNLSLYEGQEKLLMVGYLSALIGGAIWNLVATFARFPISGTHSIVGAIIGFSIVAKGFKSVQWFSILNIVASWFISPLLSGVVSVFIFALIRKFILRKEKPLEPALRSLPIFYAFTITINVFSIIHDGPLFLSAITWWMAIIIAIGTGLCVGVTVWLVVIPRQRKTVTKKLVSEESSTKLIERQNVYSDNWKQSESNNTNVEQTKDNMEVYSNGNAKHEEIAIIISPINDQIKSDKEKEIDDNSTTNDDEIQGEEKTEVAHLFSFLQILTACFGSFVHGGNDVSNAIGPLVAIFLIYLEGNHQQLSATPWYILLYGGVGISIGLWVWGRRVIRTMGNDLTKITPSTGFTIEIGAAFTVLVASKIGLPISTTHCKVGSVVMVGRLRSKESVNWALFRNIAIAWVATVPITAICSGAAMALLQLAVK